MAIGVNRPPDDAVRLHPYTPAWRWCFSLERIQLWLKLRGQVLDIQHVGSTAIPGMPAKPIINIMVAVPDFERVQQCVPAIKRLGCEYRGENEQLRQCYFVKGHPTMHSLYLVEPQNEELAARIRFCDDLIRHPDAAQAYANPKRDLAEQRALNPRAHQDAKLAFVQLVLEMALPKDDADKEHRFSRMVR